MHHLATRRHVLVAAILAAVLLLAVPTAAHAASTYFDKLPPAGSISTVAMPLIQVKVSDPAGINTGYQLKVDGLSRTPKVTWGPGNSYCVLTYQTVSALANGPHTVYASVFTGAGRTSTTWNFTTKVPPVVGPLTPADGSTTNSRRPVISGVVAPNGVALSSYSMTVDGARSPRPTTPPPSCFPTPRHPTFPTTTSTPPRSRPRMPQAWARR